MPSPENRMLSDVSFEKDDQVLAVTRNSEGTGMVEFSLADKSSVMLIDRQAQEIEDPTYAGNKILFKAHYNGIDNLYLLDPTTTAISQVTNVKYGAFDPSYDENTDQVFFSNYDGRNFNVNQLYLEHITESSADKVKNTFTAYFKPLQEQKSSPITIGTSDT